MKIFYDLSYPMLTMYIHCKSAADYATVVEKTDTSDEYGTQWDELTKDWIHPRSHNEERRHYSFLMTRCHKSHSDVIFTLEFHDVHNAHEMMQKLDKYFTNYSWDNVDMIKSTKLELKTESNPSGTPALEKAN